MNYTKAENLPSIEQTMRSLKLGGLAKEWRTVAYHDKEQYMRDLLDIEVREREANRMARMIKQANFRVIKTLDDFVWKPTIEIPSTIIREDIEQAAFVENKENLVLMGVSGTGKTHLATAIAMNLCEQGRRVRFFTAAGLANILQEKHQRGTLTSFMNSLRRVELVILDEIGFITLHKEASELFFQVISDCYEQKSLIITSNLEFSQWNTVFGNDKLTAAMIDRLIHHSHILVFSGPSHRLEESVQRQRKGGARK
ncbi:MAG: IS21-like element helper ATPase IstB [Clostridiales bacterium]|jgi:DNA replication protein DnaC|nr:IS21-like element helper ATPase IstB [Clostridiales bacterium]